MPETFVIVGAGAAGVTAAFTLRDAGFDGELVLLGDEDELPYERPPLSKEGLNDPELKLLRPSAAYEEAGIELRVGARAEELDTRKQLVKLAEGEAIHYDRLLLATGGRARRLSLPGSDLEGIRYLRTANDKERIAAEAQTRTAVVVVGLGFIGSELAATLRTSELEVTALDPLERPLAAAIGGEVADIVLELHREHGVRLRTGEGVVAFRGKNRVEAVVTDTGDTVEADFVVIGAGMLPNVELAVGAGLRVDGGIVVDERCRTSAPKVYAVGDVAAHFNPRHDRHVRVEHWDHALQHAVVAARAMLGKDVSYECGYWFWSDIYDANIQAAGLPGYADEQVLRGSLAERRFVVFGLTAGRVTSAVALNNGRDLRRSLPLIHRAAEVDASALRDPAFDLRSSSAAS
ncbi:MAG: 3-phenylpropionate/trans-cinnamate dioxygenase ferredoxin reductase component [Gaiellaceae bacterium]|nr:3-phenylpropionate/trans-cinnamate dioxygenase ferredoxin reductase component [Gaiellaceae bacterium]